MAFTARAISQLSRLEVDNAFKTAQRVLGTPGLTILVAPKQHSFGRLLVITSRKVGTAPQRNQIRRRLKAFFYEEKLFESEFDWIVITRKPACSLTFADLQKSMLSAFKNALATLKKSPCDS